MAATAHSANQPLIRRTSKAGELNVRDMVEALSSGLDVAKLERNLRSSITIAVSEALNNITEHAYAGQPPGLVCMTVELLANRVDVTLTDYGRAMPDNAFPPAKLPDHSATHAELPEGGFGLYLIHSLCDDVTYERSAGRNLLCLSFPR